MFEILISQSKILKCKILRLQYYLKRRKDTDPFKIMVYVQKHFPLNDDEIVKSRQYEVTVFTSYLPVHVLSLLRVSVSVFCFFVFFAFLF